MCEWKGWKKPKSLNLFLCYHLNVIENEIGQRLWIDVCRRRFFYYVTGGKAHTKWSPFAFQSVPIHRYHWLFIKMDVVTGSGKWNRRGSALVLSSLEWPAEGDSTGCKKKSVSDRSLWNNEPISHLISNVSKHFPEEFMVLIASFKC